MLPASSAGAGPSCASHQPPLPGRRAPRLLQGEIHCGRDCAGVPAHYQWSQVSEHSYVLYLYSDLYRVLWPVKVVKVIIPDSTSPVKVSVISMASSTTSSSELTENGLGPHTNPPHPLTNGLSDSPPDPIVAPSVKCKTPRTPTPRGPLTPEASLFPANYKYVVERLEEPHSVLTVSNRQLRCV